MEFEYEEVEIQLDKEVDPEIQESQNEDDGENVFSLFAGSAPQHVVVVEEPQDGTDVVEQQNIVYIAPERPQSYYKYDPSESEKQSIVQAAVSGDAVLSQASVPYEGLRMPWRVLDYTQLAQQQEKEILHEKKRRRPGKKTRDARKKRMTAPKNYQSYRYRAQPQYGPSRLYGMFF